MDKPCPPIDPAVVTWLESRFPDRIPNRVPSPDEVGKLVGQQEVIRLLRRELHEQTENILTTDE